MDGKPAGLVGSTVKTLEQRRKNKYPKRFGSTVELRLIREIPRPEGYLDFDYNFYLKACEAMDIARKKTYVEDGGLNRISPLIQALGHPMLEREMGRIGGRTAARKNIESGQVAKIATYESRAKGGRTGSRKHNELYGNPATSEGRAKAGRTNIESGQVLKLGYKQGRKNAESGYIQALGHKQGCKNAKNGHLARIRHIRWHVNRNLNNPNCELCRKHEG